MLRWVMNVLRFHGENLKNLKNKNIFLNLNKSISKHFKGLSNILQENLYTIKFINETNKLKDTFMVDDLSISTKTD